MGLSPVKEQWASTGMADGRCYATRHTPVASTINAEAVVRALGRAHPEGMAGTAFPQLPPFADDAAEDLLPSAANPWWGRALIGALALGCVAAIVHGEVKGTPRQAAPSPVRSTVGQAVSPASDHLSQVLAGAHDQLVDEIRQSSQPHACVPVAVGTSPARGVTAVLHRLDPALRVTDSAWVIDQYTNLCSLQVRARGSAGQVITVSVAAPSARPRRASFDVIEVGIATVEGVTTEYASDVTRDGWTVLVGATGTQRDLPGTAALSGVAAQRQLLW